MEWLEALADPIRLGIVRHLAARGSASRTELARAVAAVPETVRRHLLSLERAGVVERLAPEADSGSRGRPPARYKLVRERATEPIAIRPGLYRCRRCEGSMLRGLREEPRLAGGSCPVCGGSLEFVERRSTPDRRVAFQHHGRSDRRGTPDRRRDAATG
jgi:DNA-binding transcriptional ArsR family regulator